MTDQDFFTVAEAASTLRCHPKTILSYIQDRELKASFIGDKWIIPRDEIVRFLNRNANTTRGIINE